MSNAADIKRRLWETGRLRWKLRPHQQLLYATVSNSTTLRTVVKCPRRFGKSFVLCLIATEFAIKHPGAQIRFAAPTEKSLRKIIRPNLRIILGDCPPDLAPKWNSQESSFVFPNGSEWHIAGTDKDNVEKLRGTGADFSVIDEAGSIPNLEYVANDVLLPQTLDNGGRMVLVSTPPKTPGHPFTKFAAEAAAEGAYVKHTIWDNTFIDDLTRDRYAKAVGGYESEAWKREFECEDIVDQKSAVIPEFTEKKAAEIIQVSAVPKHFLPLVSMDVGWHDFTVALFGYYDFERAKLVIQNEVSINRMRTSELAAEIKAMEALLWRDKEVFGRWSDVAPQLIHDLSQDHEVHFSPTAKDDKDAQINKTRRWIYENRIEINPDAKTLISHLRCAIWNSSRTNYERSDGFGHYDAVDALVYMVRNAPEHVNPFPEMPEGLDSRDSWINKEAYVRNDDVADMAKIFGRRN